MFVLIITIIYILIVIAEIYLVNKYVNKQHNNDLKENEEMKNKDKGITDFICNVMAKRLEKLKTMSFKDWIKYNQDNVILEYNGQKLYIFIYEKNKAGSFIQRVTSLTNFVDMLEGSFQEYIKDKSAYFSQHVITKETAKNIYNSIQWDSGCSRYTYLWVDPFNDYEPILKTAISKIYEKKEDGEMINGFISAGFIKSNIDDTSVFYYELITNYFLVILFLFIYIACVASYFISKKTNGLKVLVLFILLNVYSVLSLISKDTSTTHETEEKKVTDLNSSILGVSFLVAANIFIIQSLKQNKTRKSFLYNESALLFCLSLVSLLIALFKVSSYFKATDIKTHRIQNQFFFNISIIINIFIILNYFSFIFFHKK